MRSYLFYKRDVLGFYKQATHRRSGDESCFLLWGPPVMTGDSPKIVRFGLKLAKRGRFVNVPKWSKTVQKGPTLDKADYTEFALPIGWLVGRSVSPLIVLFLYNRSGQKKRSEFK